MLSLSSQDTAPTVSLSIFQSGHSSYLLVTSPSSQNTTLSSSCFLVRHSCYLLTLSPFSQNTDPTFSPCHLPVRTQLLPSLPLKFSQDRAPKASAFSPYHLLVKPQLKPPLDQDKLLLSHPLTFKSGHSSYFFSTHHLVKTHSYLLFLSSFSRDTAPKAPIFSPSGQNTTQTFSSSHLSVRILLSLSLSLSRQDTFPTFPPFHLPVRTQPVPLTFQLGHSSYLLSFKSGHSS
jgi:hypothetical protein